MAPLDEVSGNARVTRSRATAQKGNAALSRKPALASGPSTESSVSRKRKAKSQPDSDLDDSEEVDGPYLDDEDESDYSPEYDEEDDFNDLLIYGEDLDEDEPEINISELTVDGTNVDSEETTGLPFENSVGPAEFRPKLDNVIRYRSMFTAAIQALKDVSDQIVHEHGFHTMHEDNKADPLSLHPAWVVKFLKCDPDVMTDCALQDVPDSTKSILGDPDLDLENCISRFRNLPKVSSGAREFFAGEYLDIVDRLWNVTSDDGEFSAGQIENKLYNGATINKDTGARIRLHARIMKKTVSQARAYHARQGARLPYHYEFGCQADPSKDGTRSYESRSDFRSLGHISDEDMSQTAWPWLRELVNQILLNMLPGPESSIRCRNLTTGALELVRDIRKRIESEFGQLPDLSSMSLNLACCTMEAPRIAGAITATRKTCIKCPRPFVVGQNKQHKGLQWQDVFSLYQPGNPFGGVICHGCKYANAPPGHKMCRNCKHYKPLEMFLRDGDGQWCQACLKKSREYGREQRKIKAPNAKPRILYTEEDDKILKECIDAKLTLKQMEAKFPDRAHNSVRSHLKNRFNYNPAPSTSHKWTAEENKTALEMRENGKSYQQIADELGTGLSKHTVNVHINSLARREQKKKS